MVNSSTLKFFQQAEEKETLLSSQTQMPLEVREICKLVTQPGLGARQ